MVGAELGALLAKILVPILGFGLIGLIFWRLVRRIEKGAVDKDDLEEAVDADVQEQGFRGQLKETRKRMRSALLRGWLSDRKDRERPPPG